MELRFVVRQGFAEARDLAAANADDESLQAALVGVAEAAAGALRAGGRVIAFGNGGSMCDASHFAEELTGRYRKDRPPIAAMALNDPGHLSCTANDYGFEHVFARGVTAHARPGDLVLALSTSGNSQNVLLALEAARTAGAVTVGFLGKGGGKARALCDHALVVSGGTADRIQEQHIQLVHMLVELIERQLHPELYRG